MGRAPRRGGVEIGEVTLPSWTKSFTAVMVMVCGRYQLAAVKVREAAETAASVGSAEEMATTTSAVGWVSRTTVKVEVPQASVVERPATGVTVMPVRSSSVLVKETSAGSMAA